MKTYLLAALAAFSCVWITPTAKGAADHCRVVVRSHGGHHHQRAVVLQQVYPTSFYSVGSSIQEEVLAERVASLVLSKLAAAGARTDSDSQPVEATAATSSLLTTHCAKCHSGENPKGNLSLTSLEALTCEDRLLAIQRVLHDDETKRMPKGQTLDPETLGRLIQELSTPIGEPQP